MSTFEAVAAQNRGNIRKPLRGTVLIGRYPAAEVISTLVAPNGELVVPTSYESVGWISEDGVTFTKDREVTDVRGWGATSFLRRDIQSEDNTIQFAALETKRLTHELRTNLDLSGVEMSADGEWKYDLPDRPDIAYFRVLVVGVDGISGVPFYTAKHFPMCVVTEMDDESWSDGDDPAVFNVTLSALVDDEAGKVGTEFLFGPGALAAAEDMGITVAGAS